MLQKGLGFRFWAGMSESPGQKVSGLGWILSRQEDVEKVELPKRAMPVKPGTPEGNARVWV